MQPGSPCSAANIQIPKQIVKLWSCISNGHALNAHGNNTHWMKLLRVVIHSMEGL